MVTQKRRVDRFTFSLGQDYRELLDSIASVERRSFTDILRLMIDRRAKELGLTPVQEIDPKLSALTTLSLN